jgi:hypothetical protein
VFNSAIRCDIPPGTNNAVQDYAVFID